MTKKIINKKTKWPQNWNETKTEMSQINEMSTTLYFSNTGMSQKLKCHKNWNVTKTEISQKLICHIYSYVSWT